MVVLVLRVVSTLFLSSEALGGSVKKGFGIR